MMHITKKPEPMNYRRYRLTKDACFADMDSAVKIELKKSLLEEQGYLCAYCMSAINSTNMKVEHYVSRSKINDLVYSNLLAVCKGNSGRAGEKRKEEDLTCDSQKGDKTLVLDPQNQSHIQTIKYNTNGTIYSENEGYNFEINNTLNLNYEFGYLLNARANTLREFKRLVLEKKYPGRGITKESLLNILNKYTNQQNLTEYRPYAGIIISYLNDKISRM